MFDPFISMRRAKKLRISIDLAVAMARAGERVVWMYPATNPPLAWAEKELRAAGVTVVSSDGKVHGATASHIDLEHL